MGKNDRGEGPYQSSHLLILGSYTVLVLGLIIETVMMGWEKWPLPLIVGGVVASWFVHFRQRMTPHQRVWIYTVLMMGTFFFYGIHITSVFDMDILMMIEILIFTISGESALVTCCQLTYFATLLYDIIAMLQTDTVWDRLLVSRLTLHIFLMFMAGWLARFIIREWARLFTASDAEIASLDKNTRRMNAFMMNLSHELRTPVNAILGAAGLLAGRETDADSRREIAMIRDAGCRMADQIGDILDYSELATQNLAVNAESYTLSSLLNDLVTDLRPRIPKGLELVIDVDAETPAGLVTDTAKLRRILYHLIANGLKYTREGGVYVHIHAERREYGVNLCIEVKDTGIGMTAEELAQVSNRFYQGESGRAMRTGGLGLGLSIVSGFVSTLGGFMLMDSAPGAGTTVRVSLPQQVTDDQPCMSVANRDRIQLGGYLNIRKFAHPQVREFYNAMIGNIVRGLGTPMHRVESIEDLEKLLKRVRLTHLFVGDSEYLSAPDRLEALAREMTVALVVNEDFPLPPDSRVLIMPKPFYCFPVATLLNAGPGICRREERLRWPGIRALVVDDEPMNLSVATGILRGYGMQVFTADSGPEAIQMYRSGQFDLVFMDHMMPGMDGIEAMHRLRREAARRQQSLPVVALTANALSTAKEQFLAEGFDGFISKPIEMPELERVLRKVLPATERRASDAEDAPAAVAAPSAPADGDRFAPLAAAGIDVNIGLRHCQQDAALYAVVLGQFAAEAPEKRRKLDAFLAEGDMANYAILVHAVKSTAAMIGAARLSDAARAQEAAAKDNAADAVRAGHAPMAEGYAAVARALESFIPEAPGGAMHEGSAHAVIEFLPEGGDHA